MERKQEKTNRRGEMRDKIIIYTLAYLGGIFCLLIVEDLRQYLIKKSKSRRVR